MHLVIVYDQWPSVTLQIDSTFLEGVVSTIAKVKSAGPGNMHKEIAYSGVPRA